MISSVHNVCNDVTPESFQLHQQVLSFIYPCQHYSNKFRYSNKFYVTPISFGINCYSNKFIIRQASASTFSHTGHILALVVVIQGAFEIVLHNQTESYFCMQNW